MTVVAHSASLLNPKSEFDDFFPPPPGGQEWYDRIVLTAFAWLNFEPWQTAAGFASLPRDVARARLAAMIATLPGMSPTSSEPATVAMRLIALLPAASAEPSGLARPTVGLRIGWFHAIQPVDLRSSRRGVLVMLLAAVRLVHRSCG